MSDEIKTIQWKLVAIEKIVTRLLDENHELNMAVKSLSESRAEIAKEEKKRKPMPQITKKNGQLHFPFKGQTYMVRVKKMYLPDGSGSHTLLPIEEIIEDSAKLDIAFKHAPDSFIEIISAEEAEKKPATKKKPASKKTPTTKK